jgi:hypothetical protein
MAWLIGSGTILGFDIGTNLFLQNWFEVRGISLYKQLTGLVSFLWGLGFFSIDKLKVEDGSDIIWIKIWTISSFKS